MIKNVEVNKLLVSWKGPVSQSNFFVGVLEKLNAEYTFKYISSTVEEAQKEGFTPFIGLNQLDKVYRSPKLFSVFERRLPPKSRHIFKNIVKENNLTNSQDLDWEYLRITKGELATDTLTFLEPIIVYQDKIFYEGDVAGWSFTKRVNRVFTINDVLVLRWDKDNSKDQKAIELLDPLNNFVRVGYIAKPFNEFFYHLLNLNYQIEGVVSSIDKEIDRPIITIKTPISSDDLKNSGCDYLLQNMK